MTSHLIRIVLPSRRRIPLMLALCALLINALGAQTAQAQTQTSAEPSFKIVVNAANPVSSLSREELSRLFLKKVTSWRDAKPVALVDQRASNPVRESFTRDVHGRQVASVTSYWQQMIFAGRAIPPVEKASDGDVAAYVASNAAAIGYVSATADLPPGVKTIAISR
jgi:ABC-type phosphate transport system substrate-binding protein